MAVNLSSLAGAAAQFFNNNGVPLAGGLIYTYAAGTTTPAATYTSNTGLTAHANPIVLDAAGRIATGEVWLTTGVNYKFLVKTSVGVQLGSYDNIPSINDFTSIYADLANTSNVALGDALVGFKQSNASGVLSGAIARTVHQKLQETVSVKDFGAVGDGVANDTAAFNAALAAAYFVTVPFGVYLIKDVEIGTNESIISDTAVFRPAAGATCIFKLTGFKPSLIGAYFDGSNGNIGNVIFTNSAVIVQDATYATVNNCQFVNLTIGLTLKVSTVTTSTEVTKSTFTNLIFDTIYNRGILVGANVNTCTFSNIRMFVGIESPSERPRRGCIGFQIVSTGTLSASGGHFIDTVDVEQAEIGFNFTDAQLTSVNNCIADSLAGSGFQCTGATSYMKFLGCFAGTTLIGFEVAGTSNNIYIDSSTTILQGVVPPWWVGPDPFFLAGSPFDISIGNTASSVIGSWFGDHKLFVETTATIAFDSESQLYSTTNAVVPVATTVYLGPTGDKSTNEFTWVAPSNGVAYELNVQVTNSPSAGQSFIYTTQLQGVNTPQTATIANTSFGAISNYLFSFNKNDNLSVKLVTSAGATASNHRIVLLLKYL